MKLLYTLLLYSFLPLAAQTYILQLQLPESVSSTDWIRAYYKGDRLNVQEPLFCPIPEYNDAGAFSVIVAEEIAIHRGKGGTVEYLKRPTELPFRWFDITYNRDQRQPWHVEERYAEDVPERLPENTIFICSNPSIVDTVYAGEQFGKDTGKRRCYITVAFTSNIINDQELETHNTRALMASLDANTVHREMRIRQQKDAQRTVSMIVGS